MAEKKKKQKQKQRIEDPFEFCEVCNRNHNQGHRHKYTSSHSRSLSSLLDRFQKKLADLRFFLKNPSVLRREHADLCRIWCVFCRLDVRETVSSFACSNAFNHLASLDHLKNLKDFFRKHGAGLDRIDTFRILETDLIKWEKGCRDLKNATSTLTEGPIGPLAGLSKDIQHALTSRNRDSFDNQSVSAFNSNTSHVVMPLQSLTNEGYRICHPEVRGPVPSTAVSLCEGLQGRAGHMHAFSSVAAVTLTGRQHLAHGNDRRTLTCGLLTNGVGAKNNISEEEFCNGLQKLTQVSSTPEVSLANVHSGALPPWLEASEQNELNVAIKAPNMSNLASSSVLTTKSRKLNPKRVGAAWAEKRRIELEMEKRGELVPNADDMNWLPNFGRVWQAGTRKESRKEFETEKRKLFKDDDPPDSLSQIQPYISKRMRTGSPHNDGAAASGLVD